MAIAQNFPEIAPSLNLDFSNVKALDPRVTFARASSATYYGTETAKAEENLLIRSQEFDNAGWTKTNVAVSANATTAPDGTTTAETVTDDAVDGSHRIFASYLTGLSLNVPYTFSCFVKAGTHDFVQLLLTKTDTGNRYFSVVFDLSTGAVTQSDALNVADTSSTIIDVGDGWYRCTITGSATTSDFNAACVNFAPAASGNTVGSTGFISYIGTSTTFSLWGAQLEQRSTVTSYQPTTDQPITRFQPVLELEPAGVARFDHNPLTFESLGLLVEEQRTNLVTRSEEFDNAGWSKVRASITANTIIAPNGNLTGDKLVEDTTATNSHSVIRASAVTIAANTAHTATAYIKAGERTRCSVNLFNNAFTNGARGIVDLSAGTITTETIGSATAVSASITPVGNSWYRCGITAVIDNSSTSAQMQINIRDESGASYTGDGFSGIFIWGAQLEVGAFPTSYIKTEASQVTRSADSASMTGSNFSSWYRQDEGTLYAEASYNALVTNAPLWNFNNTTTSNIISLQMTSSPASRFSVAVGGTGQANLNPGNVSAQTYFKLCGAYKTDDFSAVLNGGTAQLDTAGVIPVVTRTQIGGVSSAASNVRIKKLAFYPQRLTNAQLQALTG